MINDSPEWHQWLDNFLQNVNSADVEQFIASIKGSNKIDPLMHVDKKGIATIPIMGPLSPESHATMKMFGGTSTSELYNQLKKVKNNTNIKALLMPIDSPGGKTTMVDETAQLVQSIAKEKPVISHVLGDNGSAAYYITSGSSKIYVSNRTNRVGSIGTRLAIRDESEAMEKHGVKIHLIDTGKNKSIGHPGAPITDDQKAYLSDMVNELQSYFEQTVKQGRPNINIDDVNDGSVYLAKTALKKGLIDGIQSIDNTRARLEAMT